MGINRINYIIIIKVMSIIISVVSLVDIYTVCLATVDLYFMIFYELQGGMVKK